MSSTVVASTKFCPPAGQLGCDGHHTRACHIEIVAVETGHSLIERRQAVLRAPQAFGSLSLADWGESTSTQPDASLLGSNQKSVLHGPKQAVQCPRMSRFLESRREGLRSNGESLAKSHERSYTNYPQTAIVMPFRYQIPPSVLFLCPLCGKPDCRTRFLFLCFLSALKNANSHMGFQRTVSVLLDPSLGARIACPLSQYCTKDMELTFVTLCG